MSVTYTNGVFVAEFGFADRAIPKQAGFLWHPEVNGSRCGERCQACKAGLRKKWWTPHTSKAALLVKYCDERAQQALSAHLAETRASKATAAETPLVAPEGCEYLPYQRAGISYALDRPSTLIADEMGLGKTIQALGVVNNDASIKKVLVICPAPLRLNWLKEAQRWLVGEHSYYVVDSPKAVGDHTVVIANYDRLKGAVLTSIMAQKWDCLIVDEAHYLKNPKARRTKAVFGVAPTWKKEGGQWVEKTQRQNGLVDASTKVLLLTGTPILNNPIEAFPLLNAVDPKGFKSRYRFAKTYCNAHHNGYGWDYSGANMDRLPELQERLRSTVMVRRLKKDVLTELPPKRRQVICLPANGGTAAVKAEQTAYRAHQDDLDRLETEATLAHAAGDKEAYKAAVAALNAAIKVAFTEMAAARKAVALAKIDKVVEHIQAMLESGISKVVVWAHHHEILDRLAADLSALKADGRDSLEDRQAAVDTFQNDPTNAVIVCGIRSMGEGHTLTAASHEVFAELDWTPAKMAQCEDRCHRIGQTESVLIQHLVLDGSIDARVATALVNKQDIADKGLDDDTAIDVPLTPESKRSSRPSKYPQATTDQRQAATEAIRQLAARCDGAIVEDGMGFSKVDTRFGKQLAKRSYDRELTDGEVFWCTKLANKYRRQLSTDLLESIKGNGR